MKVEPKDKETKLPDGDWERENLLRLYSPHALNPLENYNGEVTFASIVGFMKRTVNKRY